VPPAPTISLTVVEGTASERAYSFAATPVAIGRGAEVRDTRQRLVRTNHVAFLEGAGAANEGVSRRHAHLERDTSSGNWRVIDDGSSQGTEVVRNGRGIAVPRGTRGLGLQAGDEIVLGRARLRIGRT
jgi:pSer/pThr/pTyr-binding forkhead associated (FHA) protein